MCGGDELFDHYRHTLEALGNQKGLLGVIFNKSQNKFQDPVKLRRLIVGLIDKETWVSMSADVKGDASKACWRPLLRIPALAAFGLPVHQRTRRTPSLALASISPRVR